MKASRRVSQYTSEDWRKILRSEYSPSTIGSKNQTPLVRLVQVKETAFPCQLSQSFSSWWLVLILNLTHSRITWEESLINRSSRSGWPVVMSSTITLITLSGKTHPPQVTPFPSQGILNCLGVEKESWTQICMHPLLYSSECGGRWPVLQSSCHRNFPTIPDCDLELWAKINSSSCFCQNIFITPTGNET